MVTQDRVLVKYLERSQDLHSRRKAKRDRKERVKGSRKRKGQRTRRRSSTR